MTAVTRGSRSAAPWLRSRRWRCRRRLAHGRGLVGDVRNADRCRAARRSRQPATSTAEPASMLRPPRSTTRAASSSALRPAARRTHQHPARSPRGVGRNPNLIGSTSWGRPFDTMAATKAMTTAPCTTWCGSRSADGRVDRQWRERFVHHQVRAGSACLRRASGDQLRP